MAAHRYWRVRCLRNNNSQTGIGELQLATTIGGSNVATGGTAIASGSYGGSYAPASAFDGNTTSNWFQSGTGPTIWLGYDFGSGNSKDINEVRIAPAVEDANGTPRFFDVESSDDGSTWAYEWSGLNTSWTNGSYVTFSRPTAQTSNRYWAIQSDINQNGDGDWVATGIEMRTSIGGSQAATGGTASAYPAGSPGPANAFTGGGDANLYYSNNASPHPSIILYDFGSDIAIREMAMQAYSTTGGNNARQSASGHLLYSRDGKSWGRAGDFSGLTWSGGQVRTFSVVINTGAEGDTIGDFSASAVLAGVGSEVPDTNGYRFWEVRGTAGGAGGYNGISRVGLARSGGANLVNPTTTSGVSGSNVQAGSAAQVIQDAYVGLIQWESFANGTDTWVAVDFGAGNLRKIREVTILPNRDDANRTWTTVQVAVWNAPDRSDRDVLQTFSGLTWTANTPQTLFLNDYGPGTVGSLSASATLAGVGQGVQLQSAVGTLTASAVLAPDQIALGTIALLVQFYATADMLGRSDPTRATVGAFSAGAGMTGTAFALGTISGVGDFSATATFGTDGFATGVIATVGAISGAGEMLGDGSGLLGSYGAFSATATLAGAGGYVPTRTVGTLVGAVTLTAMPNTLYGMVGELRGLASFYGVPSRVAGVTGAFSASSELLGQVFNGQQRAPAFAAAATFGAVGRAIQSAIGEASASGGLVAYSAILGTARGALSGASIFSGATTSVRPQVSGTAATGSFAAVGASIWATIGSFSAAMETAVAATGLAPASSTMAAVAGIAPTATASARGKASFAAIAQFSGVGQRVGFFSPSSRVLVVEPERRLVTVEAGSKLIDRTLVVAPRDKVVVIAADDRTVQAS